MTRFEMPREYRMSWIINGNDPHSDDPQTRVAYSDGTSYWIPARGYEIPNLRRRIALAWAVFSGRLDAIDSKR